MRHVRSLGIGGFLSLMVACGGGGGGGGSSLVDLSGTWLLTPAHGVVAGDPVHLTLIQAGSALEASFTCNASTPLGAGSWGGGAFALTFDFGGGDTLDLAGTADGSAIAGTYSSGDDAGEFRLERTAIALDCAHACDAVTVPRFVDTDFTELGKIAEISLLRSSAGHDYSDDCESCRSMKHYFAPTLPHHANNDVQIRSPVAGQVVSITAEGHGASLGLQNKQVRVRSSLHPEITFIFFHTDVAAGVDEGDVLSAGDLIGTARMVYPDLGETAHDFDLAVRVHTLYGDRYVSWFDVITNGLFATYVARGAAARSDFILTAAARDGDALTCAGDSFTSVGVLPAWFVLDPP